MLREISYYPIFGKPLLLYLGITTITLVSITLVMGILTLKGKVKLKYHQMMAATAITMAIIHGTLAILSYL